MLKVIRLERDLLTLATHSLSFFPVSSKATILAIAPRTSIVYNIKKGHERLLTKTQSAVVLKAVGEAVLNFRSSFLLDPSRPA